MMITLDMLKSRIPTPHELCPACAERYEECASVMTEVAPYSNTVHLKYPYYEYMPFPPGAPRPRNVYPFVGRTTSLLCGMPRAAPSTGKHFVIVRSLFNPAFIEYLLTQHPQLSGTPLTRSVLERVGVDLRAEEVMFVLAQSCHGT